MGVDPERHPPRRGLEGARVGRRARLGEERRADPTDDITSVLMGADLDGDQLTAQEFGSFFILLVVAGNETTRNAISHGMKLAFSTGSQNHQPPQPSS